MKSIVLLRHGESIWNKENRLDRCGFDRKRRGRSL